MLRLIYYTVFLLAVAGGITGLVLIARSVTRAQDRKATINARLDALELESRARQQEWTLNDVQRHRERINQGLDDLHNGK